MKEIFRTTSLEEAQVFCALLREHELEPLLDGEHSGPVTLGLYTSAAPLIVHVPDEQEKAALEILDAMMRERGGEVVFERSPELEASTPEEDARFEEQLRRSRARWRRRVLFAFVVLVPGPALLLSALYSLVMGEVDIAFKTFYCGLAFIVPAILIAGLARPKKPSAT